MSFLSLSASNKSRCFPWDQSLKGLGHAILSHAILGHAILGNFV